MQRRIGIAIQEQASCRNARTRIVHGYPILGCKRMKMMGNITPPSTLVSLLFYFFSLGVSSPHSPTLAPQVTNPIANARFVENVVFTSAMAGT
jgi:hypothetical protein